MPTWAWILIVVAVVIAAIAVVMGVQQRQRAGLRDRFGPEYERVVDERGDRREAERELADRAERRDALEITDLAPEDRRQYATRWEQIQAAFVDRPQDSLVLADELIVEVMQRRGYPVESFDERAGMVSADHPDVVDHYRAAHSVSDRVADASTEDLRQAFVHYRALFDTMLADGDVRSDSDVPPDGRTDSSDDPTDADRRAWADRTDTDDPRFREQP